MAERIDKDNTAVKHLLDIINTLKFKVEDLERRMELIESIADLRETVSLHDVRRPPYWRENTPGTITTTATYTPPTIRSWATTDDIVYAVTDDNVTVPIFTPTNSDVEPRTVTVCRGTHR